MSYASLLGLPLLPIALICGCALASACSAQEAGSAGATLGHIKADRLLVLGNSITLIPPSPKDGWPNNCGLAASVPEKDYIHIVAAGVDARSGGHMALTPPDPAELAADGSVVTSNANILNVADIIERQYATYTNEALQPQIDQKADVVLLQFGENVPGETFEPGPFKAALQTLLAGLKASSDPHVFVTSLILGPRPEIDEIKQQVCDEDPSHRVFVDISTFGADPANLASAEPFFTGAIVGHPGDKGMSVIGEALLNAIIAHSAQ
jgi:hypothetical protein